MHTRFFSPVSSQKELESNKHYIIHALIKPMQMEDLVPFGRVKAVTIEETFLSADRAQASTEIVYCDAGDRFSRRQVNSAVG